jgi:radical SAM superfamily enzyme YgiQ (UPF0313 family)
MKILLCSIPDGSLEGTLRSLLPRGNYMYPPQLPIGVLRISTWIEKNGYSADIYDINNLRPSDEELIKTFKRVKPTVVGLSATLSHCYPNVKRISKILRKLFPDIWIVVGGHLTGSSNVVLYKTETDICVVGDGEIPFLKLLDYFKLHPTRGQLDFAGLSQIKGLAFIDENNKLKVTGYAEQLPTSEMVYPDFDKHKLSLQKFGGNGELIHEFFEPIKDRGDHLSRLLPKLNYEKNENKRIAELETAKGCVARCTFCQRYTKGYKPYVNSELENQIIKLKEKYNVGALVLADENSLSNRVQSYEMARIFKKHDIYWRSIARVTSVTYEDLKFYKEHNMLAIRFGIESGSQKILDIMEKKFTLKTVYNAISNCKKLGVFSNTDQLMIGMPGETEETIIESAQFVASLRYLLEKDWNTENPYFAMAIPGTSLYEYCQQIGVIGKTLDEEEDYLIRVSEHKNTHILNYMNKTESSNKEVHYWHYLYKYASKKEYVDLIIKNNKSIRNRLSQINEKCIRGTFNGLIFDFNIKKKFYKNKQLLHKMKWLTLLSIGFLLSLGAIFLPKAILFPIIRVYANLRFYSLEKNNKVKKGKQKHNFFMSQPVDSTNNFRLTENKIAKANRQIDLSLRTIVTDNRKQMKAAITDEEKALQILAQGQ